MSVSLQIARKNWYGNIARAFGVIAAVLLAVGSLLSLRDAGGPPSPMSMASADVQRNEQTRPRYSSKPIRDIQPIADRVLADEKCATHLDKGIAEDYCSQVEMSTIF